MLSKDGITDSTKKFNKLFFGIEDCDEDEQRKKIEEMNGLMEEMKQKELETILIEKLFNKISIKIEEKKMSMENAILLLKHVGYYKALKKISKLNFNGTSLDYIFVRMILNKATKNEEKNEKLLIDLCKCFALLKDGVISPELLSICVPCLLKNALMKDKREETQKEVEIALLGLSDMGYCYFRQELYLKEIIEIIKHQQKHRNLTKLAYQSAWKFFIYIYSNDYILKDMIVNELHFGREAARELNELTRNVNWKKKKEEMSKEEAKDEFILMRWLDAINYYNSFCKLWNEECVELIGSVVRVFRAAKDNHSVISNQCIYPLRNATENRVVKVDELLKGGAVEAVLEEMQGRTVDDGMLFNCLQFFTNVSEKLKEKEKDEKEKVKRKAIKRKIFEKMEEEGYEDTITSFYGIFDFLNRNLSLPFNELSFNISGYFVYV
ncbi:uncharacterized protein MONOS_18574 [Monocercomonoides exilis]|uniref:uncharacterized protein n=1 Tax=Monocercomonoides exilis TaxID=2049356 RepID=UPI003559A4A0|nr:hypothetical protein MONOS_18574 [Monocercomonoides exilis]